MLATLLGSVSFASKADTKPAFDTIGMTTLSGQSSVISPKRWMPYTILGVCGGANFDIAVDDEDIENSVAVIMYYIDIQIAQAGNC